MPPKAQYSEYPKTGKVYDIIHLPLHMDCSIIKYTVFDSNMQNNLAYSVAVTYAEADKINIDDTITVKWYRQECPIVTVEEKV